MTEPGAGGHGRADSPAPGSRRSRAALDLGAIGARAGEQTVSMYGEARVRRTRSALAELHSAETADRLAHLEEVAAGLLPGSTGRAAAEDLLATMRQSLALMAAHRAMILREPDGNGPGSL